MLNSLKIACPSSQLLTPFLLFVCLFVLSFLSHSYTWQRCMLLLSPKLWYSSHIFSVCTFLTPPSPSSSPPFRHNLLAEKCVRRTFLCDGIKLSSAVSENDSRRVKDVADKFGSFRVGYIAFLINIISHTTQRERESEVQVKMDTK